MLKTSASRECSVWWGVKLEELLDFWQVHSFFHWFKLFLLLCFVCVYACVCYSRFLGVLFGLGEEREEEEKKTYPRRKRSLLLLGLTFIDLLHSGFITTARYGLLCLMYTTRLPPGYVHIAFIVRLPRNKRNQGGMRCMHRRFDGERCPIQRKKKKFNEKLVVVILLHQQLIQQN
jgi:hypothetical protein